MNSTVNLGSKSITEDWILNYLVSNFPGLNVIDTWGEKSLFYNPDKLLKRGIYFCTIKAKDGANDQASNLDRDDVFRINFGLSKTTFLSMFTELPKRTIKGGFIEGPYNFKTLDTLTPHPVYGWMAWVSILNPSISSWNKIEALLSESYQLCIKKYNKKLI